MKLQASVPDSYLVERYLEEIANTYNVRWRSDLIDHEEEYVDEKINDDDSDSDNNNEGGQKEVDIKHILVGN